MNTIDNALRSMIREIVLEVLNEMNAASGPKVSDEFRSDMSVHVGYDTVLGYLARHNPEALALMEEPCSDTIADGRALTALCKRMGDEVLKVAACPYAQERGIAMVNAYPVEALREHFGG